MSEMRADIRRFGRRVTVFPARCPACGHVFRTPALGDFAYGEFLLHGERGRAVAYLEAILDPVWDLIVELCPGPHETPTGYPDTARLHWVIARLADPVDGERFVMQKICPRCHSIVIDHDEGTSLGVMDVPPVSYERFLSLSPTERQALVESLSREYDAGSGKPG